MNHPLLAALATLGAIAALPAAAQQASPQRPETPAPVFIRTATPEEIKAAFKDIDVTSLAPGQVKLSCAVKADGSLKNCRMVAQSPTRRRGPTTVAVEVQDGGRVIAAPAAPSPAGREPEIQARF